MTRRELEQKVALFCAMNPHSKKGFRFIVGVDDQAKYRFVMKQGAIDINFAVSVPECELDDEVDTEYLRQFAIALADCGLGMVGNKMEVEASGRAGKEWTRFFDRAIASQTFLVKKVTNMVIEAGVKPNYD